MPRPCRAEEREHRAPRGHAPLADPDRFDGTLDQVFEIQDQIAASVATALRGMLSTEERDALRRPGTRAEAYEHFLRGRQLLHVLTRASYEAAERELRAESYAAAVLDLGLPLKDGMDVLASVRRAGVTLPVLVLTPIAIPEILMGVSLLIFFVLLNFTLGLASVALAHIAFCIGFVAIAMGALPETLATRRSDGASTSSSVSAPVGPTSPPPHELRSATVRSASSASTSPASTPAPASAIARNRSKSRNRGYADHPARIIFGLRSWAIRSTSSISISAPGSPARSAWRY